MEIIKLSFEENISRRNYYSGKLILDEIVVRRNYSSTKLLFHMTISRRNDYFTRLFLDEMIIPRDCFSNEMIPLPVKSLIKFTRVAPKRPFRVQQANTVLGSSFSAFSTSGGSEPRKIKENRIGHGRSRVDTSRTCS